MEATAKYDYEASADDELSFRKEEQLKILQTTGNWYKAELKGVMGFVPQNFINIHLPSWYQEYFSRTDAEERLMSQPVGAFVIRASQNATPGDFSISVRHTSEVRHFKVIRDSRGQYFLWSEKFPSLNQLVEHYKSNSISKDYELILRDTERKRQIRRPENSPPLPSVPPLANNPPTPSPAPRKLKASPTPKVRALYSFHAEEKDELSFNADDIIEVLERSDHTWWRGRLRGKIGLFPSNYTKPL